MQIGIHQIEKQGNKMSFIAGGDVLVNNSPDLRNEIKKHLTPDIVEFVIDLKSATMVDSAGVGLMISIFNSLRKVNGKISIVNASKELLEMFKLMRLDKHFTISA